MHLDANSIAGLSNGQTVTLWQDISGNNNDASIGSVVDDPAYITSAINGLPTVRFGSDNCYFTFPEFNNIRTVFWVCKEDLSATFNRFLLGHSTSWDFHRGHFNFWDGYWSSEYVKNGITRLNGSIIDGTSTTVPKEYSIVSLITTGNVRANQLTRDRSNSAASWHGDIAEVIVYNRTLTDKEENDVGAYLTEKYEITTTYETTNDANDIILPCEFDPNQITLIYDGANYSAWLDKQILELRTASGGVLTRWPIGTTVTQTDHNEPAEAVPTLPIVSCTSTTENGILVFAWNWLLSDGAVAEQIETLKFHDQYVEQQVHVRWRDRKPTFWRINYGGRLAGGCYDLEGLWRKNNEIPAVWLPAPVPEYFTDIGTSTYERTIQSPSALVPTDLTVVMGGVDDEDITYWDSTEIGRTPLDYPTQSWNLERRYPISSGILTPDTDQVLKVEVPNSGGPGGIWKSPCVIGPDAVLQQTTSADGWTRATAVGQTLYSWCPDNNSNYERTLNGRFTVSLTSQDRTTKLVPENITTGARLQIPPYIVAIDGLHGFWGIGTLDLPRSEDGLRVEWRDGTLTCPFLLKTGDPSEQGMWTDGPRLGLFVGSSRETVLDAYLEALPPHSNTQLPDWWTGPEYCTWGDQWYVYLTEGISTSEAMTDTRVRGWLNQIKNLGLSFSLITLDAAWWQLSTDIVDEIHADGQHVLLWTQPHWGPTWLIQESWGVKDAAGRPILGADNYILDFTQAVVRQYIDQTFGGYFDSGGYDTDGIKLDFCYVTTPLWNVLDDETWGAGEQYRARALQHCYQVVKNSKADGLLTGPCTNPLFGDVQDLCRLNEEWTGDPQTYRRRARAVLELGEWATSTDWLAYEHYLPILLVERAVWGCVTLQSVDYRGDQNNNPVPLSNSWAKRIKAVTHLGQLATIKSDQKITYDAQGNISRTTDAGALVAAALPINGQASPAEVLVVAANGRLLVAAIADGDVDIHTPLKPYKAYSVQHDGSRQEVPFTQGSDVVTVTVSDSAGAVWYYELITGDFNRDELVNVADLAMLAFEWLSSSSLLTDLTDDGKVNLNDFAVFSNVFCLN